MDNLDEQTLVSSNGRQNSSTDKIKITDLFSLIRSIIDLQKLAALAIEARRQIEPEENHKSPTIGKLVEHGFHIIVPIQFEGNIKWLAKVPVNGVEGKWDEASAAALTAEAKTMRLLKRETTIPLPEVFDYSSTTRNSIRCPYIIMSDISGLSLYDVWFGHQLSGIDMNTVHSRRVSALNDIASAMVQLGNYAFDKGGSIQFDSEGRPSGIGPTRLLDYIGVMDLRVIYGSHDETPIWVDIEAFSDVKKFYTCILDLYPRTNQVLRSVIALVRRFIEWIPERQGVKPFVLTHPNFDLKNFIVSENGHLKGIIGWQGIISTPRSIGNEKYPNWLIRDWDPASYGYNSSTKREDGLEKHFEDSPQELQRYRQIYRDAISRTKSETASSASHLNFTQMSLITGNLALCAQDPHCRNSVPKKLIREIWLTTDAPIKLEFAELVTNILDSSDEVAWDALEHGFKSLLETVP